MPKVLTSAGITYCFTGTAMESEHNAIAINDKHDSICIFVTI